MPDTLEQKPQFGCPHCESGAISENNAVAVRLRVTEWDEDGEPASFSYPWTVIDDTMAIDEDKPRFYCESCGKEFEEVTRMHD